LLLAASSVPAGAAEEDDQSTGRQRAEVYRKFALDPKTPLESRVREAAASTLKMFKDNGVKPVEHALTPEEQRKLAAAFEALPPLHRRILSERLRSVSFLDGMPNTALTSTVNPGAPYRLFDITIRAGILRQTASEWLTEKERGCYSPGSSTYSVSIEAGKRDALLFVLIHEATHIVDFCLGITPAPPADNQSKSTPVPTAFTRDIWSDRTRPAPAYRDPVRERVRFYVPGKTVPLEDAEAIYRSLRATPFVSLYGSTNWNDDLAEYAAVYHWTEKLHQPYRIVVRSADRTVFEYEPMKSELVRGRIDQIRPFYENGDRPPTAEAGAGRFVFIGR
jgi:hypothetical protein